MRKLVILRGLPGCGKSTFIKENNLENYTVSSDQVRLLVASTYVNVDGTIGISQKEDKYVWEKIYEILDIRMSNGLFTVFDATNIKTADLQNLKQAANKHNYEVFCVDMTDIPLHIVKERNEKREEYKRVPEYVIDKMYKQLQNSNVPNGIKIVKKDDFKSIFYEVKDVSHYNAVHFIGDIHGCYDALMEALENTIKADELYIFCGDYIDRGIQNAEVLNFLFDIQGMENVILLAGNHERHLHDWVDGNKIVSDVFRNTTKQELVSAGISTKKVRKFYQALKECVYITYHGQKIFACHGGVSNLIEPIDFISASQFIRGIGKYTDCEEVENSFYNKQPDIIQIHGHRNVEKESIQPFENIYNLENGVEFGGTLRMVTFTKNDTITKEIVNTTFKKEKLMNKQDVEKAVKELRENEYINEKRFNDISSFNFSRKAFEKGIWDRQTITARGLYINTKENEIVARSYEKFFRIDEIEETQLSNLKSKLIFPVTAYCKENGFLGIFSSYNGKPFFATKSSIEGDFNEYFKKIMYEVYGENIVNKMNIYCNKNNCTMVFEIIDIHNDPHIIKYNKNSAILLDIIDNNLNFNKVSYKNLVETAKEIGVKTKKKAFVFYTYKDFEKYINKIMNEKDYFNDNQIEGYVFEDARGFMVKIKTEYYNFWKYMRSITSAVMKHGVYKNEEKINEELAKEFYAWLKEKYKNNEYYDSNKIIEIREKFIIERNDTN